MLLKLTTLALIVMIVLPLNTTNAEAHHLNKGRTPCKQKYNGVRQVKCYIKRAAEHFGQSVAQAKATAFCESGYRPWANENPPYIGLYQFDGPTWKGAPWGHKSMWSARYSSLNAMWYWKEGERSRWPVCG